MDYKLSKLKNGLRILTVAMPSLESVTLTVWVRVGSRFESKNIHGLSHFIEHMVFKGSKKRPNWKAISEIVDGIGGEFNAGTSKEWTNFYIKSRSGNLETAFDVLSDMILNPIIDPKEIEKEKGVILEEKSMTEDNPMSYIGDLFERLMFEGTELGRDIIGEVETIKGIKRQDFIDYRNEHYFTDNILLTVSGGVEVKSVEKLASKYFGSLKKESKDRKEDNASVIQTQPKVLLHTKKVEQPNLIIGFRGNPMGHPDRFAEALLATILGGLMSSRLFIEIREKRGLAYSIRTSPEHYLDTGYMATYAGVEVTKVDEAIKIILNEHYGIANGKKPIKEAELKKAKEYLKGHLALSLEDTRSVNYFFGERQLLLNKIETPEQIYEGIDKVNLADIIKVAKDLFKPEKLNLAVIGPYEDKERFVKLLS